MKTEQHQGLFIGTPQRRLYAVWRAPTDSPARAALLICPPFFHEHFLSYRLLSLVAARLAARGIASLRFDYYGSGDSFGSERDFSLAGALDDAQCALDALREREPAVAPIVLGARAGAWPAAELAARHRLRLWLWQPLTDGAAWLAELERFDAAERASYQRYPFLRTPKAADPQYLLAAYCPSSLRAELDRVKLGAQLAAARAVAVVDAAQAPRLAHARYTPPLPEAAAQWPARIDMQATFITREVGACIDALEATLDTAVAA